MSKRDSQRQRVYNAERDCFGHDDYRFTDFAETESFVKKVWSSNWTRRHYTHARCYSMPLVVDGRGTRTARGSLRRINLPVWARTKPTVLHEIAHALTMQTDGAAHGRDFTATILALVKHFLGKDDAALLKLSFKKFRVKFKPKRRMSSATMLKLRERGKLLAAAQTHKET